MKRALIQSVKVTPYTSEDAINREGFLSGILAVKVGSPSRLPYGYGREADHHRERPERHRLCARQG